MQLLDLLSEVFGAIVYELVELAGSGGSWKLRGVYDTFAAEMAHDTFDKQLVKAFNNASDSRLMKECVNRYLVARLQHQLDANKRILKKLGKVVRWAVREPGVTGKDNAGAVTDDICATLKSSA
jgi:hypothetical protein